MMEVVCQFEYLDEQLYLKIYNKDLKTTSHLKPEPAALICWD